MNTELIRKLEDGGFPFAAPTEREYREQFRNPNVMHYPSLSELIEACGSRFGLLERNTNDAEITSVWTAHDWNEEENEFGVGRTPEEAVANLWLSQHKA